MTTINRLYLTLLSLFTLQTFSNEKVLIMTYSYNRPDFIELQDKCFKAFLENPYEFIVFNDAKTESMAQQIFNTCEKLNITCVRFPQNTHTTQTPNTRHADCIEMSLKEFGYNYDGIVTIIDSDMFLLRKFNIIDYVGESYIRGLPQRRGNVGYVSPALLFLNMAKLPNRNTINLRPGRVEGEAVDVGGHIYYYLKANPSVTIDSFTGCLNVTQRPIRRDELIRLGYDESCLPILEKIQFMEFYNEYFLHYYAGTNWPNFSSDKKNEKDKIIHELIDFLTNQA